MLSLYGTQVRFEEINKAYGEKKIEFIFLHKWEVAGNIGKLKIKDKFIDIYIYLFNWLRK